MKKALQEKFLQNMSLAEQLIQTHPRILEENSPYDTYWGTAKGGRNRLGVLLMELREELIARKTRLSSRASMDVPAASTAK